MEKTVAWESGGGYITLTYTGIGNAPISVKSDANELFSDRQQYVSIATTKGSPQKAVDLLVKQKGKTYPVGTTFSFDYNGQVQEITLPRGKYKLECWGAQGGNSYNYSGVGSKGGYSEGIITLTETTTLYVFVGGRGGNGSSTSLVNGGWNGGGGSVGRSSYNSGNEYGISYPACGGGGTDIALVSSAMSYASGRTNRSAVSLLSRCIVAGGGAGGSARYTEVTNTVTNTITDLSITAGTKYGSFNDKYIHAGTGAIYTASTSGVQGDVFYLGWLTSGVSYTFKGTKLTVAAYTSSNAGSSTFVGIVFGSGSGSSSFVAGNYYYVAYSYNESATPSYYSSCTLQHTESTTSTSTGSGSSSSAQQGGGTSGRGTSPGTQSSGGGEFGLGKNQSTTNYRYASGAGGGGWYGGGSSQSDSSTSQINSSGGGSGFVNIAANAGYRPSGYTGLQLDRGSTKDGSTSFPSPSGGNETGHSGNGYARITVL